MRIPRIFVATSVIGMAALCHASIALASEWGDEATALEPSAPLVIENQQDVQIAYKRIQNPNGDCVVVNAGANVVVENSYIGPCKGKAVSVSNSRNVTVRHNYIKLASSGLYAYQSSGIRFHNNKVRDVLGPRPRGQMVQFNNVTGAGNAIYLNVALNNPGASQPEDVVSLYLSHGTAASPISVRENYIRGGGPSTSGGGIMLGDNGGSFLTADKNILVDPGQYGMAVAGGTDMKITNNRIFARQQGFTNVGIYAWNQKAASCDRIEVRANTVGFTNRNGANSAYWNGGNCGAIALTGNNFNAGYEIPAIPQGWGPNWAQPGDF